MRRARAPERACGWIAGAGRVVGRGVEQLTAVTRENTPRTARPAVRAAVVLAALAAAGPAVAGAAVADAPRSAPVRAWALPGDGCVRVGGDLPLEELGRIAREQGVGEAVRQGCGGKPEPPAPTPTPTPPPPPAPPASRTPEPEAPAPAAPEPAAPVPATAAPPAAVPVRPTPTPTPTPSPSRPPEPGPSPTPSPSLRPLYHEPPPRAVDEGTSPVTRMLLFVAPAILAAAALGGSGAARNRS